MPNLLLSLHEFQETVSLVASFHVILGILYLLLIFSPTVVTHASGRQQQDMTQNLKCHSLFFPTCASCSYFQSYLILYDHTFILISIRISATHLEDLLYFNGQIKHLFPYNTPVALFYFKHPVLCVTFQTYN